MIKLIVEKNDAGQTLINFLKKVFKNEPLSKIYYLFYKKKIRVNNKQIKDFKYKILEQDIIIIYDNKISYIKENKNIREQLPIAIAYEDKNMLVVIKDHNVLVHNILDNSLDNMVKYYFLKNNKKLLEQQTFSISHQYRLDKLTKGLIIYPKNKLIQQVLSKAQENNYIIKKYYAVVSGKFDKDIDATGFIYRDEEKQKMIFNENMVNHYDKECQTIIKPVYYNNNYTLVECQLITGRKNQIRATLSYFNFPIVGDFKYGSKIYVKNKIFLFAYLLQFKNFNEEFSYLNNLKISLKDIKNNLIKQINSGSFN